MSGSRTTVVWARSADWRTKSSVPSRADRTGSGGQRERIVFGEAVVVPASVFALDCENAGAGREHEVPTGSRTAIHDRGSDLTLACEVDRRCEDHDLELRCQLAQCRKVIQRARDRSDPRGSQLRPVLLAARKAVHLLAARREGPRDRSAQVAGSTDHQCFLHARILPARRSIRHDAKRTDQRSRARPLACA
jgi:hypothetical protein